jgi:hypothetical protein
MSVEGATTPDRSFSEMFATTATAFTRIVGVTVILVLAAALGLAVGNAINERAGNASVTNAGYPAGWSGGAAVPVSQTAKAIFSMKALEALRVARGDVAELASAPAPAESDYHDRHPQFRETIAAESDYHDRHPHESEPTRRQTLTAPEPR